MKESYGEGLATHAGPESCVVIREDAGEALTGEVQAGYSAVKTVPHCASGGRLGCRRCGQERKAISVASQWRDAMGPGAVADPEHA